MTDTPRHEPTGWAEYRDTMHARALVSHTVLDDAARLAYVTLGLCGEASECRTAATYEKREDELGDLAWHIAMFEKLSGVPIHWPEDSECFVFASRVFEYSQERFEDAIGRVMLEACALAECAKRPMLGRPFPEQRAGRALDRLAAEFLHLARMMRGLDRVLFTSMMKNEQRYGTGFDRNQPFRHTSDLSLIEPVESYVVTDYRSDGHKPYRNVLHETATDERVRHDDTLTRAIEASGALDGDEVRVFVRKTGRRPFGNREVHWKAPGEYERETEQGAPITEQETQ